MNKRIIILLVMLMMSHIAHSENDGNATISLMTELSPVLNKTFLGPNPAVIMQKGSPPNQDLVSYTLRGEGKSLRVWQDADGLILKIPMTDPVLKGNTRMDETFMISRLLEVLDDKFTFSRSKLSGNKENKPDGKLIVESQGTVSVGSFLVYRSYRARGEWMKWEKVGVLMSGQGELTISFLRRKGGKIHEIQSASDSNRLRSEGLPGFLAKTLHCQ